MALAALRATGVTLRIVTAALVLVGVALLVLQWRSGWETAAVLSGSMEPTIRAGGIVVTRPVEPALIGPGDVVTWPVGDGGHITHRVVEVTPGGLRTKGDANTAPDVGLVDPGTVVGEVVAGAPYLGALPVLLDRPGGQLVAMGGLVLLWSVPGLLTRGDRPKPGTGAGGCPACGCGLAEHSPV